MSKKAITKEELFDMFVSEIETDIYFYEKTDKATPDIIREFAEGVKDRINSDNSEMRKFYEFDEVTDEMRDEAASLIIAPNPFDEKARSFVITSVDNIGHDCSGRDNYYNIGFLRNGIKGTLELIMDDTGMGYVNYIRSGIKFGDLTSGKRFALSQDTLTILSL